MARCVTLTSRRLPTPLALFAPGRPTSPVQARPGPAGGRARPPRLASVLVWAAAATALAVTPAHGQGPAAGVPKKGGVLRVAMIGEAPSLDAHANTATITREIGAQIFETLYALDGR